MHTNPSCLLTKVITYQVFIYAKARILIDKCLLHIESLKYSQNVKVLAGLWAEDVIKQTVNGNLFYAQKNLCPPFGRQRFLFILLLYLQYFVPINHCAP
ncbi:hypothetical protein CSX02_07680 [Agathobacter ruminis]|uniref:Uncharacterized protein n=1 Tax=Agathobacter ruminis TaxID=1712665 RepID=A0A2G3E2H2_9FIRM|nr:hypothetical protein CSX02_07680 [Agathobacter ruminis]